MSCDHSFDINDEFVTRRKKSNNHHSNRSPAVCPKSLNEDHLDLIRQVPADDGLTICFPWLPSPPLAVELRSPAHELPSSSSEFSLPLLPSSSTLPSPLNALMQPKDIAPRINCCLCKKLRSFKNVNNLKTHFLKFHPDNNFNNYIISNNTILTLSSNAMNISSDVNFLSNMDISNLFSSDESDNSDDSYLNQAFTANPKKALEFESALFEDEVTSVLKDTKNNFKISLLNINGIRNKFGEIVFILNKQLVDVLVINESKLTPLDDTSMFQHLNYELLRRDRLTDKGGGVLVYVKKSLTITNLSHDDKNEIIHFYINIEHNKRPLNLGFLACYRPPHAENISSFFSSLNSYVAADQDTVDELFVVGDLNFNLLQPA